MKKYIKSSRFMNEDITITMYIQPIIYNDSEISAAVYKDKNKKYHTDVNPLRIINGPLSGYHEELENPVKKEFDNFKNDCIFIIKELGFTVIKQKTSTDSEKSEYVIVYGIDDTPCGTLIYDIRISDHALDSMEFPEEFKDEVLDYLKMNNVVNGDAEKAGIDFSIKGIVVGNVHDDTWDRALNRLYNLMKRIRSKINIRLKRDNS